jgi:hypothetical protein
MSPGKLAIAAATFACMTLLSIGWSERNGATLSITSAEARTGQVATSTKASAVSRRHYGRTAYRRGPVAGATAVGAGLAAGAVGTATAVTAAATSPWGYAGGPYASAEGPYGGYYASSQWGDYECRPTSAHECKPFASKDWYRR